MTVGNQHGCRGHYDNAPPRARRAARTVPTACIQRPGTHAVRFAFCPRDPGPSEYMFQDVERAVAVYAEGQHLRACPDCVRFVRLERPR